VNYQVLRSRVQLPAANMKLCCRQVSVEIWLISAQLYEQVVQRNNGVKLYTRVRHARRVDVGVSIVDEF